MVAAVPRRDERALQASMSGGRDMFRAIWRRSPPTTRGSKRGKLWLALPAESMESWAQRNVGTAMRRLLSRPTQARHNSSGCRKRSLLRGPQCGAAALPSRRRPLQQRLRPRWPLRAVRAAASIDSKTHFANIPAEFRSTAAGDVPPGKISSAPEKNRLRWARSVFPSKGTYAHNAACGRRPPLARCFVVADVETSH